VDGGAHASSGFLNWPEGLGYLPAAGGKVLAAMFPDA